MRSDGDKLPVILSDPNDVRCRRAHARATPRRGAPHSSPRTRPPRPPQLPPPSGDYPYRAPRIDDGIYQAALPPLRGAAADAARADAAPAAARKPKPREKARSQAQRLKEAIARVTAPSAFAGAPETPLWNPVAAFAATTPERGACF